MVERLRGPQHHGAADLAGDVRHPRTSGHADRSSRPWQSRRPASCAPRSPARWASCATPAPWTPCSSSCATGRRSCARSRPTSLGAYLDRDPRVEPALARTPRRSRGGAARRRALGPRRGAALRRAAPGARRSHHPRRIAKRFGADDRDYRMAWTRRHARARKDEALADGARGLARRRERYVRRAWWDLLRRALRLPYYALRRQRGSDGTGMGTRRRGARARGAAHAEERCDERRPAPARGSAQALPRCGASPPSTASTSTSRRGRSSCCSGRAAPGRPPCCAIVAGLEEADGGRVVVGERVLSDPRIVVPPEDRGVGLVFQHLELWPHMTVAENIAFGLPGRPRGRSARRESDRVVDLAERVGRPGSPGASAGRR